LCPPKGGCARTRPRRPGVVGVTTHTFSSSDDDLDAYLADVDNKSETIREALRMYRLQREGVEDERLTDSQRAAYTWLRERVGVDGKLALGPAKSELAQVLSLKKGLVKQTVLQPLDRHGYIDVSPRMHDVVVTVRPPDVVEEPEEAVAEPPEPDEPESARDRLEALAAAGEEVSQSAD